MLKPHTKKKRCFLGFLRNCSVGNFMIFLFGYVDSSRRVHCKKVFCEGICWKSGEKIPQHWTWGWAQWRPFTFLNTPLFHFLFLLFIYYIYVWHIEIHIYLYYIILVIFFLKSYFELDFLLGRLILASWDLCVDSSKTLPRLFQSTKLERLWRCHKAQNSWASVRPPLETITRWAMEKRAPGHLVV